MRYKKKKSTSFKFLTSANSQLMLHFLSIDEKADGLKPLDVVVCFTNPSEDSHHTEEESGLLIAQSEGIIIAGNMGSAVISDLTSRGRSY